MRELIIIGAGGMGRSVYNTAIGSFGYGTEFIVKGFTDENPDILKDFEGYPPVLSGDENCEINENTVFVCSIGDVALKQRICESYLAKGARFANIIHKTALVGVNTKIGIGCIVGEYAIIDSDATIGNHVLVQKHAVVGHDCRIGDYARMDIHCVCTGNSCLGERATMFTGSILNIGVKVSDDSKVGVSSFVVTDVDAFCTVSGNPARVIWKARHKK